MPQQRRRSLASGRVVATPDPPRTWARIEPGIVPLVERTQAARRPCREKAITPSGRPLRLRCGRVANHAGAHADPAADVWWGRNAGGQLRWFPR
jgi:hypothetical protein